MANHNLCTSLWAVGIKIRNLYSSFSFTVFSLLFAISLYSLIQVDCEAPDLNKFPLFRQADYSEFIIHPGQMLYIPPKTWHYVKALDISFSVSFWWS